MTNAKTAPHFTPATLEQAVAVDMWRTCDVLILLGPAGSGKTHLAVALAALAVESRKAEKVYLTRPVVPAGEELGFLPGDLNRKMLPWLLPVHDVLRHITFKKPEEWFKEHAEVVPITYLRGRTFTRGVAVLDEAQNATYEQLKLFLTRIGPRSKLILSGDPTQSDRPDGGLPLVASRLSGLDGVGVVYLSNAGTCPRHPIIPRLLSRL